MGLKTVLAVMAFFPLGMTVLIFGVMRLAMVWNNEAGFVITQIIMFFGMALLGPVWLATSLVYLFLALTNKKLAVWKRLVWLPMMVVFGLFAQPTYWYLYLREG